MNLIARFFKRTDLPRVAAVLAIGLPMPGWAAGTPVTIDCFHSRYLPLLSADGTRAGKTLEVPVIGEGIPATYDSRGLLHFTIGKEAFTISADMALLQPKPQPLAKSDPVGGPPRQAFVAKGSPANASSLCADR